MSPLAGPSDALPVRLPNEALLATASARRPDERRLTAGSVEVPLRPDRARLGHFDDLTQA